MDLFKTKIEKEQSANDKVLEEATAQYLKDKKVIEASLDGEMFALLARWFQSEKSICEAYLSSSKQGRDEFVRGQYHVVSKFLNYIKNVSSKI